MNINKNYKKKIKILTKIELDHNTSKKKSYYLCKKGQQTSYYVKKFNFITTKLVFLHLAAPTETLPT